MPKEWHTAGARFAGGLLYLPEWRRGFTVHELRALFWRCQQVRSLEREKREIERERDEIAAQLARAERRAAFYRKNLILESRLGMCLARIAS